MQKLCPLCLKNGVRSKVKAFQINLEEAVWSCERMDCVWPIGYQNLVFFQRSAMTCNWDDSYVNEEPTPTLSELSLYTPPMTPRGEALECSTSSTMEDKLCESISSKRENTDCNKPSLELTNNKFTKEKSISRNANKQMPEIINIEKVNIDISKFLQHKYLDNERMQKHLYSTSVVNTAANSNAPFANTEYNSSNLHIQSKTRKEQSKRDNIQENKAVTCSDENTNINILSMAINSKVNMNITNNSSTINCSTPNTTDSSNINLDSMLEEILDDVSNLTEEMKVEDWLDLL